MSRRFVILIILGVLAGLAVSAAPQAKNEPIPTEKDLTATAEIVKQSYCEGDYDGAVVPMTVRLRFRNVSKHPVILARKIESPPIIHVARTEAAGQRGDFEDDPNIDFSPGEKPPPAPQFGSLPDPEHFVVLKPGEEYSTEVGTNVFAALNQARATKGSPFLSKGTHVLQVGVGTWPYDWPYFEASVSPKRLAKRWKSVGHLATRFVLTDFVQFEIPEHFDYAECPIDKAESRASSTRAPSSCGLGRARSE